MQHTLIPLQDRKRLHREYIIRSATVLIFAFAVAILVGTGALFPAYIKALFYNRAVQNDLSTEEQLKLDDSLKKAKAYLASDDRLLSALASSTIEVRFSNLIEPITDARDRVTITTFTFNQTDAKTVQISLQGVAPTRDELLSFKTRLEKIMPDTKIDIPIEQLAKNTNPPFTWKFTKKIQ